MAGFGSISLSQTVIGTLLDQRAIVLYKQPNDYVAEVKDENAKPTIKLKDVINSLWGNQFKYEELFAGLAGLIGNDVLTKITNVTGTNPYGITYIDANVSVESDLCDHPIENGALITDASIILPVQAEVTVAMPTFFAERIYEQMYSLYEQKKDRIILQTKYGIYTNLVLQNIEYELEKETIDRTIFKLTLREIQEYQSIGEFGINVANINAISNVSDAKTINIGSQIAV